LHGQCVDLSTNNMELKKRGRLTLHILHLVDIGAITVALRQMEKAAKAVMRTI